MGSSSLARDGTGVPALGMWEPKPLAHQEVPRTVCFKCGPHGSFTTQTLTLAAGAVHTSFAVLEGFLISLAETVS